jgi:predicted AAA+ superfamily ATPase
MLYFFLDEIQMVPGWERVVDRLLRGGHHLYVTGSSAALLSRELASAMRGRALSVEMFPFSFEEILRAEKREVSVRGPRAPLPFPASRRISSMGDSRKRSA